jgi:hypothetical protein
LLKAWAIHPIFKAVGAGREIPKCLEAKMSYTPVAVKARTPRSAMPNSLRGSMAARSSRIWGPETFLSSLRATKNTPTAMRM